MAWLFLSFYVEIFSYLQSVHLLSNGKKHHFWETGIIWMGFLRQPAMFTWFKLPALWITLSNILPESEAQPTYPFTKFQF